MRHEVARRPIAVITGLMLAGLGVACGGGTEAPPPVPKDTATVYAGGGTTIDSFRLDLATGALTFLEEAAAGDDAYVVALDAQRRRVYVQTQIGIPIVVRTFDMASDGRLRAAGDRRLP